MIDRGIVCGRAAERHALEARVDAARRGHGGVVLVAGVAGIGKSLLLADLHAKADGAELVVLAGAARELEQTRPFGALLDALRSRRADPEIAQILDLARGGGAGESRYLVHDRLLDLVESFALRSPLALLVDDLQWADAATVALLARLAALTSDVPLLLAVASRPSPHLEQLLRHASHQLALTPLGADDVAALAAVRTGKTAGPALLGLLDRAGGNPLFVEELLGALGRDGALHESDGVIESDAGAVTVSAHDAILSRLAFLSADGLDILRTSAVLGTTFSVSDVAAVLGRPASEVYAGMDEAARSGLIATAGDGMRFQHDIVHEAIYTDLPPSARQAMHLDAGRALAAVGADAGQVATQMALGARRGDEAAIRWVAKAVEQASSAAPEVAADLLDQLVALLPEDDPRRAAALADLGFKRIWSGRMDLAEAAAASIRTTHARPDDLARADRLFGRILTSTSRHDEALENARQAVGRDDLAPRERAQALVELAIVTTNANAEQGFTFARQAVEAAEAAGNAAALGRAHVAMALQAYLRGYFPDSLTYAMAARDSARSAGPAPEATGAFTSMVGRGFDGEPLEAIWGYFGCDQIATAIGINSAHLGAYAAAGVRELAAFGHTNHTLLRFCSGDWDEAVHDCDAALRAMDEMGIVWQRRIVLSMAARIAGARGRSDEARALMAQADAVPGVPWPCFEVTVVEGARAALATGCGDLDGAATASDRAWAAIHATGALVGARFIAAERARCLLAVGRSLDDLIEVVETLRERARDTRSSVALVEHCRGLAASDAGLVLGAARAYEEVGLLPDAMWAMEDAGVICGHNGARTDAVAALAHAVELAERLDAVAVSTRLAAHLRTLGVRRGARGGRGRPATGWAALTDSELRVVENTAEGLTNRQVAERLYVSSRTVESHLASAYRKLGVSTRAELAARFVAERTAAAATRH